MDPVADIVKALAAGAAEALQDGARDSILEAYHRLRARVRAFFAGNRAAENVLDQYEKNPDGWERQLAARLAEARAGDDPGLHSAAVSLLILLNGASVSRSKYDIDICNSWIFSVGDHNNQTFNIDGSADV
ncbi:MAG: hypothetical protein ABSA93_27475 [Streptosporangiaceae bacterium]|jgi:hypothetical protein